MKKIILIFLITFLSVGVNAQFIGKLTVGRLTAKDTINANIGIKFGDGSFMSQAGGSENDTAYWNYPTFSGGRMVNAKNSKMVNADSGYASNGYIWLKNNTTSLSIGRLTPTIANMGGNNIFLGTLAGTSNSVAASRNIFVGSESGLYNYDGDDNIYIGYRAGYYGENNEKNIFIGGNSGKYNKGIYNVFLGYNAGVNDLSSNKLIIGYDSLIEGSFENKTLDINGSLSIIGNTYCNDTLFYKDGTYSITVPAGGGLGWNDTVLDLATKADLNLKLNRGDTSYILSKTRASQLYPLASTLTSYKQQGNNLFIGTNAGKWQKDNSTYGFNNIFIGANAGRYTTDDPDNHFIVNPFDLTSEANETASYMFGLMDETPTNNYLSLNSNVRIVQSLTIGSDTAATKPFVAANYVAKSDTTKIFMKSQSNYFTHYVGELYGGGIVVAVWKTSGVEHGLIASLIDLSSSLAWSANTTTLSNSSSIYDGQANTTAMLSGGDVSKAGYICDTATTGGYSDWYLPSVTEFMQYRDNVGILYTTTSTLSGTYWTSTESEATKSLLINTQLGTAAAVNKASGYKVRAFRKY